MKTCITCGKEFPTTAIVDGEKKSLYMRSNCLDCVPFGQRPKKLQSKYKVGDSWACSECDEVKPTDAYYTRTEDTGKLVRNSMCKECHKERSRRVREETKRKAVERLGGACTKCGYDKCIAALDLHHEDPTVKEFSLGAVGNRAFEHNIEEIDKCILLCANCHREHHYGLL